MFANLFRAALIGSLVCVPFVAHAQDNAVKFQVSGDRLIFDTETPPGDLEIASADADTLRDLLRDNPNVKTVELNSGGGSYFAGFEMGEILIDYGVNTHVNGICSSSCVYILLGGAARSMQRGSRIGFHQNSWSAESIESFYNNKTEVFGWDTSFEFAEWMYEDTQQETYLELQYFIERGVDATFAIETIRNQGDNVWYPRRSDLLEARLLTE